MLEMRQVSHEHLEAMVPFVYVYIARALRHDNSEYTVEQIIDELDNGELTLWLVYSSKEKHLCGCVTTGFIAYPKKFSLELRTVTVDALRTEWMPLWEVLESYAKAHGCTDIEFTGRVGLEKITPQAGFKKTHVKMTREISYGR